MKIREVFIVSSISISILIVSIAQVWSTVWWFLLFIGPFILLGYMDLLQTKHTIRRNFPIIGHGRFILEKFRPEIMQYFVETDTEGSPINRMFRSLVYQRAKNVNDTMAFGTQMDVYRVGYEFMNHSIYAKHVDVEKPQPRVVVGGPDCKQPYAASLLNISAMSFGALSKNAVMALNKGAKLGGFAHNTGEGGLSPYHLKYEGDIIWQIGTAYFGCRKADGRFCEDTFQKQAQLSQVKMIEIKLSQGAKPGHGGVLPASKNTEEIAAIRHVEPHTTVLSPPTHAEFSSPEGLLYFIELLRNLSGGKPTGFKLCIGKKDEFIAICKAMIITNIKPDFITVDGGEGGTGAAPVEFSNSLGMPLREGLAFVKDTLDGYDLKKDIKIIASGKIFTGFHIARAMALGADLCNSARAMMLSIGCIQARECNNNTCPVGVATQNKSLMSGLVVDEKAPRVANFQHATVHSFLELVAAAGLESHENISRNHINRRVDMNHIVSYQDIYNEVKTGSLLN